MANSHADSHDLDKLTRWRQGLVEAGASVFPVYAVFLVGPEDRAAHDVFREFRSSFEERSAPYENLVIFGQHGLSKTLKGFSAGLGLSQGDIPILALISNPSAGTVYTLSLEGGSPSETTEWEPWRGVLRLIEAASDAGEKTMDLGSVKDVNPRSIQDGSMESIMKSLLVRLS